jgi:hypothetical protein
MVLWIRIASFAAYNFLIGYLLLQLETHTLQALIFFFIAMALHFLVTDCGLEEDHQTNYRHIGRLILAIAVIVGWVVGYRTYMSREADRTADRFSRGRCGAQCTNGRVA